MVQQWWSIDKKKFAVRHIFFDYSTMLQQNYNEKLSNLCDRWIFQTRMNRDDFQSNLFFTKEEECWRGSNNRGKNQLGKIKKREERNWFRKRFPKKRFGSVVIPGLRLSKVTNKWNKRFNAGKSRGVRGISPDAAIFLIYRRFAPFHRSVPSPLLLPLLRCFETREISAIQNTTLGFLIK